MGCGDGGPGSTHTFEQLPWPLPLSSWCRSFPPSPICSPPLPRGAAAGGGGCAQPGPAAALPRSPGAAPPPRRRGTLPLSLGWGARTLPGGQRHHPPPGLERAEALRAGPALQHHEPQPTGATAPVCPGPGQATGAVGLLLFRQPPSGSQRRCPGRAGCASPLAAESPGAPLLAAAAALPGRRRHPRGVAEELWERAQILSRLPACRQEAPSGASGVGITNRSCWEADYREAVRQALGLVEAGALRKLVVAVRQQVGLDQPLDPLELLARLRRHQPGSCRFLWQQRPDDALIGASPERLLAVRQGQLRCDALAGTAPSGNRPGASPSRPRIAMSTNWWWRRSPRCWRKRG